MTAVYTFSKLGVDEIVSCLNELDIQIDKSDFKAPLSPVVFRAVYIKLLHEVLGVSKEEIEQPDAAALDGAVEYSEMHQQSIPEMAFFRWLSKLMSAVMVLDFKRSDVEAPRFDRTVEIFSAIINFLKFRVDRSDTLEQYNQSIEELANFRDQKLQECADFDNLIKQLTLRYQSEEPHAAALDAECAALEKKVAALNEAQARLRDETALLKSRINDTLNDKSNLKLKIVNAKQDCARLSSQIVPEPEKLKKQLEEKEELIEVERNEVKTLDTAMKELHARGERFDKIVKDVHRCLAHMQECGAELAKISEAKVDISAVKRAMGDAENETELLKAQEVALRRQIQLQMEKAARAKEKLDSKRGMAASTLENVAEEQQQLEKENVSVRERVAANEEAKKKIVSDMQAMKEQHEEELAVLFRQYDEVEARVKTFHAKMLKAMRPEVN